MDTSMKERLTGAVILVVLVVALVPELLSGPKPASAPHVATTTDGAPIQSVIMNLSEPLPAGVETPPSSEGATTPMPTPAPTPSSTPMGTPSSTRAATSSSTGTPTGTSTASPAGSSTGTPRQAPASPPPPAPGARGYTVATLSPPPAPASASRATTGTPGPGSAGGAAGTVAPAAFVVQAGTFSNRANANRLAKELSAKGLAAHVAMMPGAATPWFRVRVGPAGDRGTALALLARVRSVVAGASLVSVPAPNPAGP